MLADSLHLLDSGSLRILRPEFLAFNEAWLSYCTQKAVDDLPLPLMASQGFDQIFTNRSTSQLARPGHPKSEEWSDAVNALRTARGSLHQLRLRLQQQGQDFEEKSKRELSLELDRQLAAEKKALIRFRQLNRRIQHDGTLQTNVALTDLARSLTSEETLVIVYRSSEQRYGALIVSADRQQILTFGTLSALSELSSDPRAQPLFRLRSGTRSFSPPPLENTPEPTSSLEQVCHDSFWDPLDQTGMLRSQITIVTTLGVEGLAFEAGNRGFATEYFTSLGAVYRSKLQRFAAAAVPTCKLLAFADGAWRSRDPIPFVDAEVALIASAVPNCVRVTAAQLTRRLRQHSAEDIMIHIVCHGLAVGRDDSQFSILAIDHEHRRYLSPRDFHSSGGRLRGLYLSACMGALTSETSEGDRYGLISSLQSTSVGPIVASSAPLPDFYMPIFSALYWNALMGGSSAAIALCDAKRRFRQGDWPEDLIGKVRDAYKNQIMRILKRYKATVSDGERQSLAYSSAGWLMPTGEDFAIAREYVAKDKFEALFDHVLQAKQTRWFAKEIADHLVFARQSLPRPVVSQISAFMMTFG